jgi:hypothetical protein
MHRKRSRRPHHDGAAADRPRVFFVTGGHLGNGPFWCESPGQLSLRFQFDGLSGPFAESCPAFTGTETGRCPDREGKLSRPGENQERRRRHPFVWAEEHSDGCNRQDASESTRGSRGDGKGVASAAGTAGETARSIRAAFFVGLLSTLMSWRKNNE